MRRPSRYRSGRHQRWSTWYSNLILFAHPCRQDWQWDGQVDYRRPRRREAASLFLKAGENSTINYILPMIVGSDGYEPVLEVILDTVTLTSSVNDIQLLSAESCNVWYGICEHDLIAYSYLLRFGARCLPLPSGTIEGNGTSTSVSANRLCTSSGSTSTCSPTLVGIGLLALQAITISSSRWSTPSNWSCGWSS